MIMNLEMYPVISVFLLHLSYKKQHSATKSDSKIRLRNFLSSRKYSGQNGAFDFSFYLVKVATPWLSAHVTGLDSVIFLPQPNITDVMVLIYGVGPWFRTPLLRTAQ
jgi:hypothetical protein